MDHQHFGSEEERLLAWARSMIGNVRVTWRQARPWSLVLRLSDDLGAHHFLKHSVHRGAKELLVLETLASTGLVPHVVAASENKATFIMLDHGARPPGTACDFAHVLESVAMLEVYSAEKLATFRDIEAINAADDIRAFLDLLVDEALGVLQCADASTADTWAWSIDLLRRHSDFMEDLVGATRALPRTLSHCDLHTLNTGIRADGTVVIADWADAANGPAGTGLATMLDPFALASYLEFLDPDDRANPVISYIHALANLGYSSQRELSATMRGAAVLGYIRSALGLLPYYHQSYNLEFTRFMASQLAAAIAGMSIVGLGLHGDRHDRL